ncbi:MAG: thiamine pyrophosphate-binding protein, partial [Acidobacteriia bacterium 12-62-4]
ACVAAGGTQVVSVDGDGGFQFNIQELATVATNQLPIKMFVANNNGYASIRSSQNGYFQHLVGCDASSGLKLPPLEKLVPAYGVAYEKITANDDLHAKIAAVLAAPGPVICEVVVHPDEVREPRLSSFKRPDGSMASKPMEDLFPFLPRDEFLSNMLIAPIAED